MTKLGRGTSVKTLLLQCGWLSVRQLATYHSLNLIYKTKRDTKPKYFYDKFTPEFAYQTRLAQGNSIRSNEKVTKTLTQQNFTFKSIKIWNELPIDIRTESSELKYKRKVKAWIKSNISI